MEVVDGVTELRGIWSEGEWGWVLRVGSETMGYDLEECVGRGDGWGGGCGGRFGWLGMDFQAD